MDPICVTSPCSNNNSTINSANLNTNDGSSSSLRRRAPLTRTESKREALRPQYRRLTRSRSPVEIPESYPIRREAGRDAGVVVRLSRSVSSGSTSSGDINAVVSASVPAKSATVATTLRSRKPPALPTCSTSTRKTLPASGRGPANSSSSSSTLVARTSSDPERSVTVVAGLSAALSIDELNVELGKYILYAPSLAVCLQERSCNPHADDWRRLCFPDAHPELATLVLALAVRNAAYAKIKELTPNISRLPALEADAFHKQFRAELNTHEAYNRQAYVRELTAKFLRQVRFQGTVSAELDEATAIQGAWLAERRREQAVLDRQKQREKRRRVKWFAERVRVAETHLVDHGSPGSGGVEILPVAKAKRHWEEMTDAMLENVPAKRARKPTAKALLSG